MKVVLVDVDEDALSRAEAECQAALDKAGLSSQGTVMSVQADVGSFDEMENVKQMATLKLGTSDVALLMNNGTTSGGKRI